MLFSKRRRYKLVVHLQTVVRDQVSLSEKLEFIKYQNRIMLQRFSCISFLFKPPWLGKELTSWSLLTLANSEPGSYLLLLISINMCGGVFISVSKANYLYLKNTPKPLREKNKMKNKKSRITKLHNCWVGKCWVIVHVKQMN